MNNQMLTLAECGVELIGGQIMTRISAKNQKETEIAETRRVVIPKCIRPDGSIAYDDMAEEDLTVAADPRKLTVPGDIVMKLSSPYDAAVIDEESSDCIVPSFCAIIKASSELDPAYLLAFLNRNSCKEQLKQQVAGAVMAMLSVGKIKSVRIPVPDMSVQREIGQHFLDAQRKLRIVEQIIKLEQKKNDIYFRDMVKNYD